MSKVQLSWLLLAALCFRAEATIRLCNKTFFSCQCGTPGYTLHVTVKQCSHFHGLQFKGRQCSNPKPEEVCPRLRNCHSDAKGCSSCPPGRFGHWCEERCTPLQIGANVQVTMDHPETPTVAYFACERGFYLVGATIATCLGNRAWSEPSPKCERLSFCPDLGRVANGRFKKQLVSFAVGGDDTYANGSAVEVTCDDRYDLVGEPVVKCRDDGTWSTRLPTCLKGACPFLVCCASRVGTVIGSVVYHQLSAFCRAAVHAGRLNDAGGIVAIMASGNFPYFGESQANGVDSVG
ncbi:hypothetical protein HPB52_018537 [Rhipicephalus sanguineus]|uniref:Uncharacterized protein n=1 Tax=Rhipicephalus sanguineus TaxID=34632 RepID=A0A9D4PXC7_RHISA|nr:hypothetical protein HPB52_018537 [Rhipicephalus sanguineus]